MTADAFNAATPLDTDQAQGAASELRALKLRLNNVQFSQNGALVTNLHDAWQLDFTGTGVSLSVSGNVLTINGLGAVLPADMVATHSLQTGTGTSIKTASYIGVAQYYQEAASNLDQAVYYKDMTGTVNSSDLGRTWQATWIQTYDGLLNSALNPVNVCAANFSHTMIVGSTVSARGSAVNGQLVIQPGHTDNAFGANEYSNLVTLLDPFLGQNNSGNTYWGHDYTINGPKDGPEYRLVGQTICINKWNSTAATSGELNVGQLVTTRPKGGAGSQNRSLLYTFPVDIGHCVSGFSGLNDPTTVNGGYAAGATYGFITGYQVGGKVGPWLNDGSYTNGGSKFQYGFGCYDYTDVAFHARSAHPSATNPRSFKAETGTGHIEIVTGTWNQDHHIIGGVHFWNDGTGVLRFKNGVPANATDGTVCGGATSGQAAIQYQDEGTNLGTSGTVTSVNFTGTPVTATRTTNALTVNVSAQAPIQFKNAGTNIGSAAETVVNFTGAGVTATESAGTVTVTIPGGGSSGVTSLAGTTNEVAVSASTGAVTISAPTVNRALCAVNGSTGGLTGGSAVGIGSSVRNSLGSYTVGLSPAITNPIGCVSVFGSVGFAYIVSATSTAINVATYDNTGAQADRNFTLIVTAQT